MLPTELTEFAKWPEVDAFVKTRVSPHFADIRSLLQQPGYNFIAAHGICTIVSGLSTTLFKPATASATRNKRGDNVWSYVDASGTSQPLMTRALFILLLEHYYPWGTGEDPHDRATELYELIRCPFSHALGEDSVPGYTIVVRKGKKDPAGGVWTDAELTQIETDSARLFGLPLAWTGSGTRFDLSVESFYRSVFHLLRRLGQDAGQMAAAQLRFQTGTYIWNR